MDPSGNQEATRDTLSLSPMLIKYLGMPISIALKDSNPLSAEMLFLYFAGGTGKSSSSLLDSTYLANAESGGNLKTFDLMETYLAEDIKRFFVDEIIALQDAGELTSGKSVSKGYSGYELLSDFFTGSGEMAKANDLLQAVGGYNVLFTQLENSDITFKISDRYDWYPWEQTYDNSKNKNAKKFYVVSPFDIPDRISNLLDKVVIKNSKTGGMIYSMDEIGIYVDDVFFHGAGMPYLIGGSGVLSAGELER